MFLKVNEWHDRSGQNRWRFRSARIRIQVLGNTAVFLEILFTDAARDYIKCFYITENSAAVLRFGGVSGEEKRLPGRFARWLKPSFLSYFFVAWVLSDNSKNIFRPQPRKVIHDLLLSQQKTEAINIGMNSSLYIFLRLTAFSDFQLAKVCVCT